ncbi:MAG: heme-binding protein [Actinomycetales bacterium]|nr:heme-binding protein [Actinomycetales bacterium]
MTKKLAFRVISKHDEYELRAYDPFLCVEVDSAGEWLQAGNRAFQPLVGYISGNNRERQKFSMTAPVFQTGPESSRAAHTVSFVLPVDAAEQVPESTDSRVRVVRHEGGKFAAITFRGLWSEKLFMAKANHLIQKLKEDGITISGQAMTARYDPPWKPGFARRNEILVPIRDPENTKE